MLIPIVWIDKGSTMTGPTDYLTVHVLDTTSGRPAAGMSLVLRRAGAAQPLAERSTNADGRCDSPLLAGAEMVAGAYELTFDVAGWRAGDADPGFYDSITIRFTLQAGPGHVHIPLLLAPYGYSTYRGS